MVDLGKSKGWQTGMEQGDIMKLFSIKKLVAISALGMVTVFGTSIVANAQGNWRNNQQQERLEQQRAKAEQERLRAEQERIRAEQARQAELNRRGNPRQVGGGFYNVRPGSNTNARRYRVYRNGGWYNTDNRGAELLRQAVQEGYRQGFAAGRTDRGNRRGMSWNNSSIYRSGTYGYQSYVDRSQYQYYFQQGFQKGYQDGYNSRYQYGINNGGTANILGTILNSILNLQSY